MIWFTSDLHLNHRASIEMCSRPFADIEEMNRVLIQNINARVKKHDKLYLVGDIAHKGTVEEANRLISKMNGTKILIKGNHDRKYDPSLFEGIYDFLEIHAEGHSISLMHYPMVSWPKSYHGSLMLHGHSHNKPEYNLQMREEGIRRYDVGVDANYYAPVSLYEILEFMGLR